MYSVLFVFSASEALLVRGAEAHKLLTKSWFALTHLLLSRYCFGNLRLYFDFNLTFWSLKTSCFLHREIIVLDILLQNYSKNGLKPLNAF